MHENPRQSRGKIIDDFRRSFLDFDPGGVNSAAQAATEWLKDHIALDFETYVARLQRAFSSGINSDVDTLVQRLMDSLASGHVTISIGEAETILELLQREFRFDSCADLGDSLIGMGVVSLKIRRIYARSLIETDRITPAIYLLEHLAEEAEQADDQEETSEAYGLLGRCYKQLYVDCAGCRETSHRHLQDALECYWAVYADPAFSEYSELSWHAVNLATLGKIAADNKVQIDFDWEEIAEAVIHMVQKQFSDAYVAAIDEGEEVDRQIHWKFATLAEANIALENYDKALKQMVRFANEHHTRFRFAGTLRQFEQVVRLDPSDKQQGAIIHFIRAMALNNREECELLVTDGDSQLKTVDEIVGEITDDPVRFEGIFGTARFKTYLWYRTGLQSAGSVAKITDMFGTHYGTGFLVDGGDFHRSLKNKKVLMTNAHVVSPDSREQHNAFGEALAPEDARVVFEATQERTMMEGLTPVFTSGRDQLDFTILTFDKEPDVPSLPVTANNPSADDRVYIIGHPQGAGLSFSIQDNQIVDLNAGKIRYQTPTQKGSSGSPLFNESWEVFGLHHAEISNPQANEGILFRNIVSHLDKGYHD